MKSQMKKMRRHILPILVFFLLIVQAGLAWHSAEHGVAPHDHAGKSCEFCILANDTPGDIPAESCPFDGAIPTSIEVRWADQTIVVSLEFSPYHTRAPPVFA